MIKSNKLSHLQRKTQNLCNPSREAAGQIVTLL